MVLGQGHFVAIILLADRAMSVHDLIQNLVRAKLELQDERVLEQFWFTDNNHIVATLGTKGGAVCGPVFKYRVTPDNAVEILSGEKVKYRWEQLQLSGDVLAVVCAGKSKIFTITLPPERKRFLP
jgi:hypothetical protein